MKNEYKVKATLTEGNKKRVYEGVIKKVGNKWRIEGKGGKLWKAEYDSKEDAEAGLRGYFAQKNEAVIREDMGDVTQIYDEYDDFDQEGDLDLSPEIVADLKSQLEANGYKNVDIEYYQFDADGTVSVQFEHDLDSKGETFSSVQIKDGDIEDEDFDDYWAESRDVLREYIDLDEREPEMPGDAMLGKEIEEIERSEPQSSRYIDQIRKIALAAMHSLADQSQSEEFKALNNIFSATQKFNNKPKQGE